VTGAGTGLDVLLFVAAALRISVPYTLASLGATFSERGGVINIALEGIMLNGALAYVLGAWWSHDPWIGVGAAVLAGVATAALHALVTVVFRADQITSGLGINLLAAGLTKFILTQVFQSSSNSERVVGLPALHIPWLGNLPGIGAVFDAPLVPITLLLILGGQVVLFRSVFGMRLRTMGERPEAGATLGLSVGAYRTLGVLASGVLAGLAGAWLASEQHSFTDGMTGGRGYIALAAMIVGKWSPWGAAAACLLFGAAEALQIGLQGSRFPNELLQMLPYLVTMLALAGWIGRAVPPRAVGVPYDPEDH
jgi:general nucleoside transport system permease protein